MFYGFKYIFQVHATISEYKTVSDIFDVVNLAPRGQIVTSQSLSVHELIPYVWFCGVVKICDILHVCISMFEFSFILDASVFVLPCTQSV